MECINEFIGRHAGLLEQTDECPDFQLAVVWNDATHRTATHDNVATALADNHEAQTFQRPDSFGT